MRSEVSDPLSFITTPLLAGLPGFQTTLRTIDHSSGDYQGVYQWETTRDPEQHARTLRNRFDVLPVPDSVSYEVLEDTPPNGYIGSHYPASREDGSTPRRFSVRRTAVGALVTGAVNVIYWRVVRPWHRT